MRNLLNDDYWIITGEITFHNYITYNWSNVNYIILLVSFLSFTVVDRIRCDSFVCWQWQWVLSLSFISHRKQATLSNIARFSLKSNRIEYRISSVLVLLPRALTLLVSSLSLFSSSILYYIERSYELNSDVSFLSFFFSFNIRIKYCIHVVSSLHTYIYLITHTHTQNKHTNTQRKKKVTSEFNS